MQKWLDNFDAVTATALAPADAPVLSALLTGAALARLQGLLTGPSDWVELTLINGAGVAETIKVWLSYPGLRNWAASPLGPQSWPAGSRVIAAYSAAAAARAGALVRTLEYSEASSLELSARAGSWEWAPLDGWAFNIIPSFIAVSAGTSGEEEYINIELLLTAPHSDDAVTLRIVDHVPRYIKLPAGATMLKDSDTPDYIITLAAASAYRIRFQGGSIITLEISDFSEYLKISLS
jgi:hypothetical protein